MKVAALDFGSNTFLCLIAEVSATGIETVYSDQVEIVRLGEGLNKNKKFSSEALVRAETTLKNFSETIKKHHPEQILAMATSAARDAENQSELFALAQKYQIPLEIIPGDQEAQITYSGGTSGLGKTDKNILVIDIGGGSTEFIFGKGQKLINGKSLDIGCVRLTERFISAQPTEKNEIENLTKYIKTSLEEITKLKPKDFTVETILAVAGTPTALAAAELGGFDETKIDNYKLSLKSLENWINKLACATLEEKINMGIPKGRADVILVGVITLVETLKQFGLNEIQVSTRGVRYGVALEVFRRFSN